MKTHNTNRKSKLKRFGYRAVGVAVSAPVIATLVTGTASAQYCDGYDPVSCRRAI
ncbi:MAG: hypothetical protein R3A47_02330 [Polyangiales bacterium]